MGDNGISARPPGRSAPWVPETEAERNAIRDQLERLLASSLFRNSKRYPALLRFTVERALEGESHHLKERTLGIQVFGREPDYDTNQDPVVRATAVEIRKRIAQYYAESGASNEIRIDFPLGSYAPEFRLPPHVPVQNSETPPRKWRRRTILLSILVPALVAILTVCLWHPWSHSTAFEEFWGPIVDSPAPALLCLAGSIDPIPPEVDAANRNGSGQALTVSELQVADRVAFSDATALSQLAGVLRGKAKSYRIRRTNTASLADMRDGPDVLIGAFNNYWTLRFSEPLRFHFQRDRNVLWIEDRQHPSARNWRVDVSVPYPQLAEDYAVVSRSLDPTIGRIVVVAGGLTRYGTLAAGEFLSEPAYLEQAYAASGGGWKHRNIQIVLSTKVVDRISGPPRVLAVNTW